MLERFPAQDAPNSADRSIATSAITDEDFTNFNKRSNSSMSVLEALLPNHAMLASPSKEDVKLKQIEAKNKQLELRIQLEAMKMGRAVSELTRKRKRSKKSKRGSRRSPSPSSSSSSSSSSSESEAEGDEVA